MGQVFTSKQIFANFLNYAKDAFACFIDLENAYDQIAKDKLWRVLFEYGIDWCLLMTIESLFGQSKVSICVNCKQSKLFYVVAGFWQ